jgi:hypothetical protein
VIKPGWHLLQEDCTVNLCLPPAPFASCLKYSARRRSSKVSRGIPSGRPSYLHVDRSATNPLVDGPPVADTTHMPAIGYRCRHICKKTPLAIHLLPAMPTCTTTRPPSCGQQTTPSTPSCVAPMAALLQPIKPRFDALLHQDKAALLQPITHGFGAHLRRYRAALLQLVSHIVGALLRHHKAALLQPINHGFEALLRQDKAALLQPINHGFWRPLAPIPDCPLAADKPCGWRPLAPPQGCPLAANILHHGAHLHHYRTALLRSKTKLQTPLFCPVNGLPSCNPKAHHPRLQTSYLLAPSCTKFSPGLFVNDYGSPLAVQISPLPHTPSIKVANSFHNLENSPPVCAPPLCSTAFSPLDKRTFL